MIVNGEMERVRKERLGELAAKAMIILGGL